MRKSNVSKVTSARVARVAAKVLRDGRTSKASKTTAGSALAQRPSHKKKKLNSCFLVSRMLEHPTFCLRKIFQASLPLIAG